jgi:hypothetical protein
MPCQSYDTAWAAGSDDYEVRKLKKEADRLARIACKAMEALTRADQADFLLLKDDEVREWWIKHQEDDRRAQEKEAARLRREQVKQDALAKLTTEEREALGIKTPRKRA